MSDEYETDNDNESENSQVESSEEEESAESTTDASESSENEEILHYDDEIGRNVHTLSEVFTTDQMTMDEYRTRLEQAGKEIEKCVDEITDVVNVISSESKDTGDLKFHGTLKDFQVRGVQWMVGLYAADYGGILADEMGCGKTVQTIALLVYIKKQVPVHSIFHHRPHLIVAPLSILENWNMELAKFAPALSVIKYLGEHLERSKIQTRICNSLKKVDIVLTTYEMCNKDSEFFTNISWHALIVDEAHRLKNPESLLYRNLSHCSFQYCLLLTGTPIQNNLKELHALLKFTNRNIFPAEVDTFIDIISSAKKKSSSSSSSSSFAGLALNILQSIIKPFMLRREKEIVVPDLPPAHETVLYANITDLQKKIYLELLGKNAMRLKHVSLANILMQLRKCLNHPYIFPGVEPEPFVMGNHLIEASGKLIILDKLLAYLAANKRRVLIFSQMTSMLDILQDFLDYREYSYDRLDGSVRGQDRFDCLSHFSTSDTFVFLLSTRAGGLGLNLTAADVVIFYDSDFNPQADLQAAARVHRIGQKKIVSIIRLVTRATVEEVILKRAEQKAKLAQNVLTGINRPEDEITKDVNILKFGLGKLMSEEEKIAEEEADFEKLFASCLYKESEQLDQEQAVKAEDTIYKFEGRDYFHVEKQDAEAFDKLPTVSTGQDNEEDEHGLRRKRRAPDTSLEEEYERLEEEKKRRRAEAVKRREEKKLEKWRNANYTSTSLSNVQIQPGDHEEAELKHLTGSINRPQPLGNESAIIISCCLDNSGKWSTRGVFGPLSSLSKEIEEKYALAHDMQDVHIGDVHLIKIPREDARVLTSLLNGQLNENLYFAGMIVQKRSRQGIVSEIDFEALENALKKLGAKAKELNATIHFPHIGSRNDGTFYQAERLIKRCIVSLGVNVLMYYYRRGNQNNRPASTITNNQPALTITNDQPTPSPASTSSANTTAKLFENANVFFYPVEYEDDKKLVEVLSDHIMRRGGTVVEDNLNNSEITHIIVLSNAYSVKSELETRDGNDGVVLVKPSWIIDSIANVKLESPDTHNPFG